MHCGCYAAQMQLIRPHQAVHRSVTGVSSRQTGRLPSASRATPAGALDMPSVALASALCRLHARASSAWPVHAATARALSSRVHGGRGKCGMLRPCSSSSLADALMAEEVIARSMSTASSSDTSNSSGGDSEGSDSSSSSSSSSGSCRSTSSTDSSSGSLLQLSIPTAEDAGKLVCTPVLLTADPAVMRKLPAPKVNPNIDIATDLGLALILRDILAQDSSSNSSNSSTSTSSPHTSSADSTSSAVKVYRSSSTTLTYHRDGTITYTFNNSGSTSDSSSASSSADGSSHAGSATTSSTSSSSSDSDGSRQGLCTVPADAEAAAWHLQQQRQQHQAPLSPLSPQQRKQVFCGNCCTPREAHTDACPTCGHKESNTAALTQPLPQPPGVKAAAAAMAEARRALANAGVLTVPPTLLAYDERMLGHAAALAPLPERPERLQAIMARLHTAGLTDLCEQLPGRLATDQELLRVHSQGLLDAVAALSSASTAAELAPIQGHLGEECLGNRHTHLAARVAAGTAAEVAARVVRGEASSAFAVVRPAGHMASHDKAESGSYFNNAAVAARAAQAAGASRVLIVDWDVHHAKGTQSIFEDDPSVTVVSLHRLSNWFFPGTGPAASSGADSAAGRNLNIAWSAPRVYNAAGLPLKLPPVTDGDYMGAFTHLVLPVAHELRPDIIIVSAGFDAVDRDPVGELRLHPECYAHMTAMLAPIAPLVMLLEGGYNLSASAHCAELCLRVLLGERPDPLPGPGCADITGWTSILRTLLVQQEHWNSLKLFDWVELAMHANTMDAEGEDEEDEEAEEAVGEEQVPFGSERLQARPQAAWQSTGAGEGASGSSAEEDSDDDYDDEEEGEEAEEDELQEAPEEAEEGEWESEGEDLGLEVTAEDAEGGRPAVAAAAAAPAAMAQ